MTTTTVSPAPVAVATARSTAAPAGSPHHAIEARAQRRAHRAHGGAQQLRRLLGERPASAPISTAARSTTTSATRTTCWPVEAEVMDDLDRLQVDVRTSPCASCWATGRARSRCRCSWSCSTTCASRARSFNGAGRRRGLLPCAPLRVHGNLVQSILHLALPQRSVAVRRLLRRVLRIRVPRRHHALDRNGHAGKLGGDGLYRHEAVHQTGRIDQAVRQGEAYGREQQPAYRHRRGLHHGQAGHPRRLPTGEILVYRRHHADVRATIVEVLSEAAADSAPIA